MPPLQTNLHFHKPAYYQTANTTSCSLSQEEQDQMTPKLALPTSKGKHVSSSTHNISKIMNKTTWTKPTTTSHHSKSSVLLDRTIPHGEDCTLTSTYHPIPVELPRPCLSPLPSSIPLNSQEEDGYLPSQTQITHSTRATYWALTSWDQDLTWERVLSNLTMMGPLVVSILSSQSHMCKNNKGPHRHWIIKMSRQIRKSQFPLAIRQTCRVAPVTSTERDTLNDAIRKYIVYIRGKGANMIERGVPFRIKSQRTSVQRTKR